MANSRAGKSDRPSGRGHTTLPNLHTSIAVASGRQFANRHYDDAVFNAFKAVEDRVKKLTEHPEIGKRLMAAVLHEKSPRLDVTSEEADTYQKDDEQEGFRFLFMGATLGLRNPRGHGGELDTSPDEAVEMLGLASLLMRRLDRAEKRLAASAFDTEDGGDEYNDEEPGTLDLIAAAEEALPELSKTLGEMSACIVQVGDVMKANAANVRAAAEISMSARLIAIKAMSDELMEPTQRFQTLSTSYVDQVNDLNGGMEALIHFQPFEEMSVDDQAQYMFLAESIKGLRDASIEGVGGATSMSKQFTEIAQLSRHLKKPAGEFREGIRQMQSAQHFYEDWVDGFAEAGAWGDPAA
jgi:uncharacterized protein (TIGR02391 family)